MTEGISLTLLQIVSRSSRKLLDPLCLGHYIHTQNEVKSHEKAKPS